MSDKKEARVMKAERERIQKHGFKHPAHLQKHSIKRKLNWADGKRVYIDCACARCRARWVEVYEYITASTADAIERLPKWAVAGKQ